MILAYHGTAEENVTSIQHYGFRKGTYFAFQAEDALEFGGPYVFTVRFSNDPLKWHGNSDGWQFWIRKPLPPSTIQKMERVQNMTGAGIECWCPKQGGANVLAGIPRSALVLEETK